MAIRDLFPFSIMSFTCLPLRRRTTGSCSMLPLRLHLRDLFQIDASAQLLKSLYRNEEASATRRRGRNFNVHIQQPSRSSNSNHYQSRSHSPREDRTVKSYSIMGCVVQFDVFFLCVWAITTTLLVLLLLLLRH
jgi:hypothetical protein